jgi:hypothetical protein
MGRAGEGNRGEPRREIKGRGSGRGYLRCGGGR